jgi:hypothetical protein
MLGCWRRQPADRLSIKELRIRLDHLYHDELQHHQQRQQQQQLSPVVSVVDVDREAAKSSEGNRGTATVSLDEARSPMTPAVTQYLQLLPSSTTSSAMD